MKRTLRRGVALFLVGLGALALVLSGAGALPGAPAWVWLVLVALGVVAQVAGDHYDQRIRLARKTAREFREIRDGIHNWRTVHENSLAALRVRVDEVGTPEGMKALVERVNRITVDLAKAKETTDSIVNAGGLKTLMSRRP